MNIGQIESPDDLGEFLRKFREMEQATETIDAEKVLVEELQGTEEVEDDAKEKKEKKEEEEKESALKPFTTDLDFLNDAIEHIAQLVKIQEMTVRFICFTFILFTLLVSFDLER